MKPFDVTWHHQTRWLSVAILLVFLIGGGCKNKDTSAESNDDDQVTPQENQVADSEPETEPNVEGKWNAVLESPGGSLEFGLSIEPVDDASSRLEANAEIGATILNGPEQIPVSRATFDAGKLMLDFPHYDSRIEAEWQDGELAGTWLKRAGLDEWTEMSFRATRDDGAAKTASLFDPFLGRWMVDFESSEDVAIGVFQAHPRAGFVGTFLTSVGDYRYLSGRVRDGTLWMSCFDGGHAFLFRASPQPDGSIQGDFWSRDSWHESWTATRDDEAALTDAFSLTSVNPDIELADLTYPDVDGNPRSLVDPSFQGKVRILHIFGSWCPNCHDAGELMAELLEEYKSRGLAVQGLAFELTGDFSRDAIQVRHYLRRHNMHYPVLIVGLSDKSLASEAFPLVDRIRSYPTTIFLDHNDEVRAIHTGFSGPATGATHDALVSRFHSLIEELLEEAESSDSTSTSAVAD